MSFLLALLIFVVKLAYLRGNYCCECSILRWLSCECIFRSRTQWHRSDCDKALACSWLWSWSWLSASGWRCSIRRRGDCTVNPTDHSSISSRRLWAHGDHFMCHVLGKANSDQSESSDRPSTHRSTFTFIPQIAAACMYAIVIVDAHIPNFSFQILRVGGLESYSRKGLASALEKVGFSRRATHDTLRCRPYVMWGCLFPLAT
jgi:hypothetical protein